LLALARRGSRRGPEAFRLNARLEPVECRVRARRRCGKDLTRRLGALRRRIAERFCFGDHIPKPFQPLIGDGAAGGTVARQARPFAGRGRCRGERRPGGFRRCRRRIRVASRLRLGGRRIGTRNIARAARGFSFDLADGFLERKPLTRDLGLVSAGSLIPRNCATKADRARS